MSSDAIVTARDVLKAILKLRRSGRTAVMRELEALEPDLAEFAMEELTAIHHALAGTGLRSTTLRRLSRRIEVMLLVLITALRTARLRLWNQDALLPEVAGIAPQELTRPDPQSKDQSKDSVTGDTSEGTHNV